ncbi:response regulator transcription factor [Clostridium amazonitimonense]|uniref:response regulator transcription factor n=1 Tax=Clostridium amazonitimonense TaxID=1499689 RepID=UPI000AC8FFD0
MNNILIVEDDISVSDMLKNYLINEGFQVKVAYDGQEAIDMFNYEKFDLLLLDLMIPKIDGMTVLKTIREKDLTPILIISAKGSDLDKALGLGFGADDYIAKPFSLVEVSARIKANIRRATKYITPIAQEKKEDIINIKDLNIDLLNFTVTKRGLDLKLTSREFDILKLFATNINRVFTKAQIYGFIWNDAYYGDENVINVHIRRLREKIEDDPSKPIYIKTLWGIGYKMEELK